MIGSKSEIQFAVSSVAVRFVFGLFAHTKIVLLLCGHKSNRLIWGTFV